MVIISVIKVWYNQCCTQGFFGHAVGAEGWEKPEIVAF